MKLILGEKEYLVKNSQRPRLRHNQKRTWDSCTNFVNGVSTRFYMDTTWGYYTYFEIAGKWYRVSSQEVSILECFDQSFELVRGVPYKQDSHE